MPPTGTACIIGLLSDGDTDVDMESMFLGVSVQDLMQGFIGEVIDGFDIGAEPVADGEPTPPRSDVEYA